VEDVVAPALYAEMGDAEAADYGRGRAAELSRLPGVRRTTWWSNANPGRRDLPRQIPEFSLLGLCEAEASLRPPLPPPGFAGHLFHHCPRPGQGCLSARPTLGLLLVLISPKVPEAAQQLRDWADFVHIRHIAAAGVPGYCLISPYRNALGPDPAFLHLYEMDTDDPEAAFRSMVPRVVERLGAGPGSPAYEEWASHDQLRIVYVNTFVRRGAIP
jgi:hypothetical protein